MGFLTLNELSSQRSFYFPGIIIQHSISKPLTQSGPLRRMIIAAKFNETAQLGWPELQIIRKANNVTNGADTYIAFTTNATGPRSEPVYCNVYEYDLNPRDSFEIQIGDKLNISWSGDVRQPDQIRFSLAYYNNGILIPMASIFVGDYDPSPDFMTLNSLYCEDTVTKESISTTVTQASTNQSESDIQTDNMAVIISGVVVFSLFLLITLLISLVVFTFVVKRRRKSASRNAVGSTEMSGYTNQP